MAEVQWRRGSLVRDWRGGGVGELREAKAELARVLARAEGLQRGGSTAGLSSLGLRMDGGGVLGSGSGETAKERGERFAGVLLVLVRARDRGPGCCAARATAAARWRPASRSGRVAVRGKLQREGKVRWRRVGRDAWAASASRRWLGGGPERRAALPSGGDRRSRAGRQAGGRGKRTET